MAVIEKLGPAYPGRLHDLNAEVEAEVQLIQHQFGPDWMELSREEIKPRKGDLSIEQLVWGWLPYNNDDGELVRVFQFCAFEGRC